MASKGEPRTVLLDGRPMVVLSEQEYEALVSSRRQLGPQISRLKKVREALFDVIELVDLGIVGTTEEILAGPSHIPDGSMNFFGALRRAMATTGYSELKEFQRVEVTVADSQHRR